MSEQRDTRAPEGGKPAFLEIEARLGAHNYKPLDVVLSRGEGVWVWDTDGNRYLDCRNRQSSR
jgi:ornithine--oxo-acid transaminase